MAKHPKRKRRSPLFVEHGIAAAIIEQLTEVQLLLPDRQHLGSPAAVMAKLRRIGVNAGLEPGKQADLAALVFDLDSKESPDKALQWLKRERRDWEKNGTQRIKNLRSSMVAAQKALESLLKELSRFGLLAGTTAVEKLRATLILLDVGPLRDAEELTKPARSKRPSRPVIPALYDFFERDCGLKRDEAEIRVAKIGNRLWDWNYAIVEDVTQRSDTRKGCEAVRLQVRRHRRRDAFSRKFQN
jgi:hypothetical protein